MANDIQFTAFVNLLGKMNMYPQKYRFIHEFSEGRTTKWNELDADEKGALIQHLRQVWDKRTDKHLLKSADQMRRKFFSYCHKLGWTTGEARGGRKRLDYKRIRAWLLKSSIKKKKLDDYTLDELLHLLSQIELVYKKQRNGVN